MIFNWKTFLKQSIPYTGQSGDYDEFIDPLYVMSTHIIEESKKYSDRLSKL